MAIEQDPTDPTGVKIVRAAGGGGPDGHGVRARQRKANAALQMRLAGSTWEEVADVIGYPTEQAAIVATEQALEKELLTEDSQARMRNLTGKRLERLLRAVWAKAINPEHPDQMIAIARARDVIDRHIRLYGLDAPTEMVVHSPTQVELEKWVATVVSGSRPALVEADIFDDTTVMGEVVEIDETADELGDMEEVS